jgi:hypothetical protein
MPLSTSLTPSKIGSVWSVILIKAILIFDDSSARFSDGSRWSSVVSFSAETHPDELMRAADWLKRESLFVDKFLESFEMSGIVIIKIRERSAHHNRVGFECFAAAPSSER